MPDGKQIGRHAPGRAGPGIAGLALLAMLLVGCVGPLATATPTPTPTPTRATPIATGSPSVGPSATPTASVEPPLSLALPQARDARRVRVTVQPTVPGTGTGHLTIKVTSRATTRVKEVVLRWPTPLDQIVFLSPFQPSPSRLTDALIQPWTKWVIGPGEEGEPAGTTSLGWGPLDPGATLTIPLIATRRSGGPVAFDMQVLAGEALLTTDAGAPAETRVSIP